MMWAVKAFMLVTAAFTDVDVSKIYVGSADTFKKPAEVCFEEVLKATPEFEQMKDVEHGTGKYWILLSQASDHTRRVITDIAGDYDLIAERGYLKTKKIECVDITQLAVDKLKPKKKHNAVSFKGRTRDFESQNLGSNPSVASKNKGK